VNIIYVVVEQSMIFFEVSALLFVKASRLWFSKSEAK